MCCSFLSNVFECATSFLLPLLFGRFPLAGVKDPILSEVLLADKTFSCNVSREPEKVLQFDSSRAKKKQKLDASGNTRDLIEPLRDGPRDATIDHSVHSPGTFAQTNAEPQAAEHQELPMEQGELTSFH